MAEYVRKQLGERLVEAGLITAGQYKIALQKHFETKVVLRQILIELGFIKEERLMEFLSEAFAIPLVKNLLSEITDPEVIALIPEKSCRQYFALPISRSGGNLTVAMADPLDVFAIDDLKAIAKCPIKPVLAPRDEIIKAFDIYYESRESLAEMVEGMTKEAEELEVVKEGRDEETTEAGTDAAVVDAPIIRLVNTVITQAIKERASDIHIEPDERQLRIRYRIDGILREAMVPPKRLQPAITSRIKIMAGMDISLKRAPQDGRFKIRREREHFDIRISTIPTIYGEKVVLRLLDQSSIKIGLAESGFSPETLARFQEVISRPYGIVLVTGPTGSGKTTTLYLALKSINSPDKNIITIEDPVEYDLEGINQIPVNIKAGVTFASGLRSILRQDPDVIMVGEMRDLETADVAVRAALTGHLVFSTLHTNDAPSSVARMVDMGIAPYLVTSAVVAVMAQRLVRVVCPKCKESYQPPPAALREAGLPADGKDGTFYRGAGCEQCHDTGYLGRTGLFELMVIDKELRKLIHAGRPADELRAAAQKAGMKVLWEDGLDKARKGLTSLDELKRVTFFEPEG